MEMPKELLEKIAQSRVSGGGNNIRYGEYLLMLKNAIYEQKHSGRCLIVEFRVVEARKTVVAEGAKTVDIEPNAVGSECSTVINWDGKGKASADGNAKAIVLGLWGMTEDQVKAEEVMASVADLANAKAANGMLLRCAAYPKEVRSRPGNFITGLKWSCADRPGTGMNTAEEIAKRLVAEVATVKAQAAAAAVATPAPSAPSLPPVAPPLPTIAPPVVTASNFPPAGWFPHPTPGYFHNGVIAKSEAELRALS